KDAGVDPEQVHHLVVAGPHDRAVAAVVKASGMADRAVESLASTVGNTGAAHPSLLLASALERCEPGQVVVLVALADGADAIVLRATDASAAHPRPKGVAAQAAAGAPVAYGRFLAWRGLLPVEPPRRPEPARPSAAAAGRTADWKFGFVGSAD